MGKQMQALGAKEAIKAGAGKEVRCKTTAGLLDIALFEVKGEIRAYLNVCPHQGRNLAFAPDEFLFAKDGRLVCPHHGATFDVATGECTDGPCKGASLTPLETEIIDGTVYLLL